MPTNKNTPPHHHYCSSECPDSKSTSIESILTEHGVYSKELENHLLWYLETKFEAFKYSR